jgi:toxin ParE1/3/4
VKSRFTPMARDDLESIWEYIAADNPSAATRVAQILMQKCQALADNPLIGRRRDELAPDLRSLPAGNYLIFYRASAEYVDILRILNAARDIDSLFQD